MPVDNQNLLAACWKPTETVAPDIGFSTNFSGGSAEARDGGLWDHRTLSRDMPPTQGTP